MINTMVCEFASGIDELHGRTLTIENVLTILNRTKRFSVFEATCTHRHAVIMDDIERRGLVARTEDQGYPWVNVVVTEAGYEFLASSAREAA